MLENIKVIRIEKGNKLLFEQEFEESPYVGITDDKLFIKLTNSKKYVRVTTQEQWDFVTEILSLEWGSNWFRDSTLKEQYIDLTSLDYAVRNPIYSGTNYYTFEEWLQKNELEEEWIEYLKKECRKRYKEGDKYKSAVNEKAEYRLKGERFDIYKPSLDLYNYPMYEKSSQGLLYANGRWAEVVKEEVELVDGEIYIVNEETQGETWIVRYKNRESGRINFYSLSAPRQNIILEDFMSGRFKLKEATTEQKKELIREEVKAGYFHNLK